MFGSDAFAKKLNFVTINAVRRVLLGNLVLIWSMHWQRFSKVADVLSDCAKVVF